MTMPSKQPLPGEKFIALALLALAGPLIWVVHFAAVYIAQHAICVIFEDRAEFWVQLAIILVTAAALLALAVFALKPELLRHLDNEQDRPENTWLFFVNIMRLLALMSFFAVLWSGIALFFLPACSPLT